MPYPEKRPFCTGNLEFSTSPDLSGAPALLGRRRRGEHLSRRNISSKLCEEVTDAASFELTRLGEIGATRHRFLTD